MSWLRLSAVSVGLSVLVAAATTIPLHGQENNPMIAEHATKAEAALRAGDRAGAETEFREMITIEPDNAQAWTSLGVLLYGSGKAQEAAKALQTSLHIDPTDKRAQAFLGLSYADQGDCGQATPILQTYFSGEAAGKLQRLVGLALLQCAAGAVDPLPAMQAAARLKVLYPSDADVLFESAELYTRLWNQSAGELLSAHPDSYRVHQLAGEVYEAQNNYDQAIREYGLALATSPKLPDMHFRIGQIYLRKDMADSDEKAAEEFRQEKAVNPQSAVADLALAGIKRHEHKLKDAEAFYQDAIRLDPSLVDARVGLAQTLLDQQQVDEAIQDLLTIVAEHPKDAGAHYALMLAYRAKKEIPEATREMATFRQLQAEKDSAFNSKISALLSSKSPVLETSPR